MASYDYRKAMYDDIKEYIDENINVDDFEDGQELYEQLNDDLWIEDSVTGNGSGSYTFDRAKAKEYVQGDPEAQGYIKDMCDEFGIDGATIGEKFLDEDWEYFDVSIRCYLLGQVLGEVLDEMGIEY